MGHKRESAAEYSRIYWFNLASSRDRSLRTLDETEQKLAGPEGSLFYFTEVEIILQTPKLEVWVPLWITIQRRIMLKAKVQFNLCKRWVLLFAKKREVMLIEMYLEWKESFKETFSHCMIRSWDMLIYISAKKCSRPSFHSLLWPENDVLTGSNHARRVLSQDKMANESYFLLHIAALLLASQKTQPLQFLTIVLFYPLTLQLKWFTKVWTW